jgi:hypothetical protein
MKKGHMVEDSSGALSEVLLRRAGHGDDVAQFELLAPLPRSIAADVRGEIG